MTVTSRPAGEQAGARVSIEGGMAGPVQPVGAPAGTLIRVEDLFYNVPARRKFMKKDTTEHRQIDTLVTRYALAFPQVRFHLYQEGRPALQTSGNGDRREVLASLYGVEVAREMLEVLSEEDGLRLTGFISPTSLTRSNRREITFFVNGRPVQDASLVAALIQAYHTLLMVGRFPLGILFLKLPPEEVDVNVHPTKAEVRFRDGNRIFSAVQHAVRRALLAYTPVPEIGQPPQWTAPASPETEERESTRRQFGLDWGMGGEEQPGSAQQWDAVDPGKTEAPWQNGTQVTASPPSLPATRIPILRLVGQIAAAFLVAEGPDGLYLIDQHAAHERVLFERLMAQHNSGTTPSQSLLQAAVVELPPASARLIADQLQLLEHLGFQVEPFGQHAFLVRSLPALLSSMDPAAALQVLVEDFEEDETPLQAEVEARIVARVCKRAAVKAGQVLSPEEQSALLADLEACQSPRTCPHGRPTMIHLSVDLLERQFGRKGAR
jgi:DNA mismatch repair protein MutL